MSNFSFNRKDVYQIINDQSADDLTLSNQTEYCYLDQLQVDGFVKLWRLLALALILVFLYIATVNSNYYGLDILGAPQKSPTTLSTSWTWDKYPDICIPGQFRSISQLPHDRITFSYPFLYDTKLQTDIPFYFTHNLNFPAAVNKQLNQIKSVIIIQHGNLRNGNDYFCGVINSLLLSKSTVQLQRFMVIAPQFLADGDICWNNKTSFSTISFQDKSTWCNLQVFSSEGWKDGHNSMNSGPTLYSYDVYNMLIQRLFDSDYLPNLEDITLFGFSAGAQVLLRYAAYPLYTIPSNRKGKVKVRYVVSDPSTYLYFDRRRPVNDANSMFNYNTVAQHSLSFNTTRDMKNSTIITCSNGICSLNFSNPVVHYNPIAMKHQSFALPNQSWNHWKTDADGLPWITEWEKDQCSQYNDWRYGLENFAGYFKYHASINPNFNHDVIQGFKNRNIVYLAGTSDTLNCKLSGSKGCDDNELATYCQAMLQGNNRLDRILKWKAYLLLLYANYTTAVQVNNTTEQGEKLGLHKTTIVSTMHPLIFSRGVEHDPVKMVFSNVGRCVIFNLCEPII